MGSRAEVSTMTDEAGRFLISGLPDGGYTIYVDPPEKYQPQSENRDIGEPDGRRANVFVAVPPS
jgi:hypothetical protein